MQKQKIITRAEAKAKGLPNYFTGKPCKNGHIAPRRTVNSGCCACQTLYAMRYEQSLEGRAARERYRQLPETKAAQKAYRQQPSRLAVDRERQKRKVHKRKACELARTYPDSVVPLSLTSQKRLESIYRLAHALRQRTGEEWHVDHCYPVSRGGVHHPDNLMVLPASLNRKKGQRLTPTDPAQVKGLVTSLLYRARLTAA